MSRHRLGWYYLMVCTQPSILIIAENAVKNKLKSFSTGKYVSMLSQNLLLQVKVTSCNRFGFDPKPWIFVYQWWATWHDLLNHTNTIRTHRPGRKKKRRVWNQNKRPESSQGESQKLISKPEFANVHGWRRKCGKHEKKKVCSVLCCSRFTPPTQFHFERQAVRISLPAHPNLLSIFGSESVFGLVKAEEVFSSFSQLFHALQKTHSAMRSFPSWRSQKSGKGGLSESFKTA